MELCLLADRLKERDYAFLYLGDLGEKVHSDVKRDLIVARARGVKPLSGVADAFGQDRLDVHVDVLGVGRELDFSGFDVG